MIASRLDDDERSKFDLGRQGEVNIINESGFYMVVLRSDKPVAKRFRKWVTSEVLPSIRKAGAYQAEVSSVSEMNADAKIGALIQANRLFKSNLSVAKVIFKGNQALLSANRATCKTTQVDVLENIGATHLLAESKDVLLTVSDIGKQIGLSGQKVNRLLEESGFVISFRDYKNKKQYELTERGEKVAEVLDTGKKHGNGTPVKQIKWRTSIVDVLRPKVAV
jgi:prophage antirepressor-like protein